MAQVAKEVTDATLLVFDIDATLVHFRNMVLSPQGHRLMVEMMEEKARQGIPQKQIDQWKSIIYSHEFPRSIEPALPLLFKDWSRRKVLCLGLTARPSAAIGFIKDSGDFVLDQLDQLDLSFTLFRKAANPIILGDRSAALPALFKRGCIFTACQPKGPILIEFLRMLKVVPQKILFVDDRLRNVHPVAQELNKQAIPNICFHYRGLEKLSLPYNEEVVKAQIKSLTEKGRWVTQEQAKQLLINISR